MVIQRSGTQHKLSRERSYTTDLTIAVTIPKAMTKQRSAVGWVEWLSYSFVTIRERSVSLMEKVGWSIHLYSKCKMSLEVERNSMPLQGFQIFISALR